jgi:hypothetical protein
VAYADDLLKLAGNLVERGGNNPKQATLRRGVSTAYYAFFHLLVGDFVANWAHKDQRGRLGRMFDHKRMKETPVIPKIKDNPDDVERKLATVMKEFGEIQGLRHTADYDIGFPWTRTDARSIVNRTQNAFGLWREVRSERIVRDHMLTVFGAKTWPPPGKP